MEKERFYSLARNLPTLNGETLVGLRKITEEFPLFHAAWMLYLKNLKDLGEPEFDSTLKKAAPLLPDRKQLYRFLHAKPEPAGLSPSNGNAKISAPEYPLEKPETPAGGDSLIDKFLSISSGSLKLNKPNTEDKSTTSGNDIITRSVTESDEMLTETLANIYVRQKKYDKALEAFEKLSLKYPEKNSYFASRIEEIEKLKNI